VVCSTNPNKNEHWFSPKQCQRLWQAYQLPVNVEVVTIDQLRGCDRNQIVMIRGVRNGLDLDHEKEVVLLNHRQFGIDKYFYLISRPAFQDISSSRARQAAEELRLVDLAHCVAPLVATALLEKGLGIKNLFVVVGRPGSGKTTFLKMLAEEDSRNHCIITDEFNEQLRPLLIKHFGGQDLIELAVTKEAELIEVISQPWLALLSRALDGARGKTNVFLEIAYALQSNKRLFRFAGGKIIYVGCQDARQNEERIDNRGTPQLKPFVSHIPNLVQSTEIARDNQLWLTALDTSGTIDDLREKVKHFNQWLEKEASYGSAVWTDGSGPFGGRLLASV
jgi:phosphopantetheine adenylyltransferase/dephospho-CoA kinase